MIILISDAIVRFSYTSNICLLRNTYALNLSEIKIIIIEIVISLNSTKIVIILIIAVIVIIIVMID